MDRVQIAIIAVAVALIVIAMLNAPGPPPQQVEPAPAPTAQRPEAPLAPPPRAGQPLPPAPSEAGPVSGDAPRRQIAGRVIELENDALKIRVSSLGGRIESIQLPHYRDRVGAEAGPVELVTATGRGTLLGFLGDPPLRGLESAPYEVISSDSRHVELRTSVDSIDITHRVTIDDAGYGGWMKLSIRNRGTQSITPRFDVVWYGQERSSEAADRFQNYSLIAVQDGEVQRTAVGGIGTPGFFRNLFGGGGGASGSAYPAPVDWAGIDSQYFLLAAIPENPREATAYLGPLGADLGQAVVSYPPFQVPPQTGVERTYRLYMGPKIAEHVLAVSAALDPATVVGWVWVRPLVDLFAGMLKWTYAHIFANYGVAIILLTILLRLVTFPLTQRSMKSMKRFAVIAPEMKAIQEKYADDRTKMQEELMKLYRQKGMNPLAAMGGGCIPMLIQMPFMIALYFALQSSMDLRHAPFALWINDLSAPENLFAIAGIPVRVLPLLMGASMLLQQRLTPTPSQDPQQRQMMQWMSVMFIFLFYQFPSGLVLYWFVSNLLGIAQQLLVNRSPAPAPA